MGGREETYGDGGKLMNYNGETENLEKRNEDAGRCEMLDMCGDMCGDRGVCGDMCRDRGVCGDRDIAEM